MEEDKIINIDGDSSSSGSESGGSGDEEEAANSAAGKGGSSGEDSDGQSWDGGDDSGEAASPVEIEDPSQESSEEKATLNESDDGMAAVVASSSHQAMQFLQDSDDEEEKAGNSGLTRDAGMQDVFGEDSGSEDLDQEAGPSRRLDLSSEKDAGVDSNEEEEEDLDGPPVKRQRVIDDDEEEDIGVAGNSQERLDIEEVSEEDDGKEGNSGERADSRSQSDEDQAVGGVGRGRAAEAAAILDDEADEGSDEDKEEEEEDDLQLQEEVAELRGEAGETEEAGMEREQLGGGGEDSDDEPVEDGNRLEGMSDWDLMMQRRKAAMDRARRKRRGDGDETIHDDIATALIEKMKDAAEQDRHLNMARKAATKKIQLLPTVMGYIKKASLQSIFVECGILSAFSVWLSPLPDHSLPHLKIRESILDTLKMLPTPDSSILKSSKIGKAVMLLYQHPKETRKNREKAGKLINEWARPIFGLASDFKMISREERETQDYANLSQEARRRISTGERRTSQDEDVEQPQKPGDKGWVGRARVPMPSTKGYVVRPKWNVDHEFRKKGSTKKTLNRYEKHLRKKKQEQMQKTSTHAVSISIEGRHMPL